VLPNLSIKTKLYLIILVMLIPMLTIQCYYIITRYNCVVESEMEANQDFAVAIGRIFQNFIIDIGDSLYFIGMTIADSPDMDDGQINSYLELYNTLNPTIKYCLCFEPEGTVINTSLQNGRGIGANGRDRNYFQRLLDGEDLVVSEVIISRITGKPAVVVGRAIRKDNQLKYVISVSLDIENLDNIMPEKRMSPASSFGLADSKEIIVYHKEHPAVISQMLKGHSGGPIQKALSSGLPAIEKKVFSRLSDTYLSVVAVPIPEIGWVAYANSNYQEVFHIAVNSVKYNLLVLLTSTLVSLFVAYRLCQRIIKPVNDLQQFAQNVCNGNLEMRTSIAGGDELAVTGAALNEMAARMRQLETSQRLFIQSSAHELRNPLAGIRGIVSLLRRRLASGKKIDDKILTMAEKEVDRLAMTVNQLFDTFEEEQQDLPYSWETVDLAALLNEIASNLQVTADEHNFILELGDKQRPLVRGDADKLRNVLCNLLSNAVKYSPGGGEIVVTLGVEHSNVVVEVKDEGIGIPNEHLEFIFESFFRSENYAGVDPGGIGLGLSISKEIVLKHGGQIWAKNNSDRGSTFYVKLPLYLERRNDNESYSGD
jgi:signal transduction histidine kinase